MCADILKLQKFQEIQPQAPLGGPDDGKDILCERDGLKYVVACYFPKSSKRFSDIKRKFNNDMSAAAKHNLDGFMFMTNQAFTLGELTTLETLAEGKFSTHIIYNKEDIRVILDSAIGVVIRARYLNIEISKEEIIAYLEARDKLMAEAIANQDNLLRNILDHVARLESSLPVSIRPAIDVDVVHSSTNFTRKVPDRTAQSLNDEIAMLRKLLSDAYIEIEKLREQLF